MSKTPINQKTATIKVKRIELCDLLLACSVMRQQAGDEGKKWEILHNKLKSQLDYFDTKLEEEKELSDIKKSIGY